MYEKGNKGIEGTEKLFAGGIGRKGKRKQIALSAPEALRCGGTAMGGPVAIWRRAAGTAGDVYDQAGMAGRHRVCSIGGAYSQTPQINHAARAIAENRLFALVKGILALVFMLVRVFDMSYNSALPYAVVCILSSMIL